MLLHFNPQNQLLGSVSIRELLLECFVITVKRILQQNSFEIIFAEILLEAVQTRVFGKHDEAANFWTNQDLLTS